MGIAHTHRKPILIVLAALSAIVLAGFVGASSFKGSDLVSQYPNDRANHHPVHPSN